MLLNDAGMVPLSALFQSMLRAGVAARREARERDERRTRGRTGYAGWSGCPATPGWRRSAH
jgi:hypothetical protein